MRNELSDRIESKTATIGVVGLGYVGLPLCAAFVRAGYTTVGFDIDGQKIEDLEAHRNYLSHLGEHFVRELNESGRFSATSDFGRLGEPDAVLICVPTPLGIHLEPDLSYVEQTADAIAKTLRAGQLIILESTTFPSTTRKIVLPRLEASGLTGGKDFFVAFSPEREDPGRKDLTTSEIPKLVGGLDPQAGELATALYRSAFSEVVPVSSAEVAESAKLLENIYRAVNIALVNELKVVLQAMDIDVWEVVDAAATKPFGYQPFYPGPGLGGHCIPIDPFYLSWKAREVGEPTRFIELAGQINHSMPGYVVRRIGQALNDEGQSVSRSKVLILGLAYKPDVDDVRESPAIELISQLKALGAEVDYHDPHVAQTHKMRRHDLKMQSVELTDEAIEGYDCIVIATDHSDYDWAAIGGRARLIVDTRGAMRGVGQVRAKVIVA